MADPKIGLIVVNYRTPYDLARFVRSVTTMPPQTWWRLTIVNVDPLDADVEMALNLADGVPEVTVVNIADNVGYARACNRAAAMSENRGCDYLALFNADVALTKGAVDACIQAFEQNPGWGILGPRQIDSRGRVTHAGIFGTRDRPQHRAWQVTNRDDFGDVRSAVTVSGAAYFVRRRCWDELTDCEVYRMVAPEADGAFLPTPHYFEETFCSYHASAHGWGVYYFGPVTIIHEWHKASPVGGWAERQFPVSQRLFRVACDAHDISHD